MQEQIQTQVPKDDQLPAQSSHLNGGTPQDDPLLGGEPIPEGELLEPAIYDRLTDEVNAGEFLPLPEEDPTKEPIEPTIYNRLVEDVNTGKFSLDPEAANRTSQEEANWAERVGRARNRVDTALEKTTLIPTVAASLANKLRVDPDQSVQPRVPTIEEIKQEKPVLVGAVSKFIGFFSSKLANRFDNYCVRKAQQKIEQTTTKVVDAVEAIGRYESPKQQFVTEIAAIRAFIENDANDAPELYDRKTRESRLSYILEGVIDTGTWRNDWGGSLSWLERHAPMTRNILPVLMNEGRSEVLSGYTQKAKAVTPEVLKGLDQFLQLHGEGKEPSEDTEHTVLGMAGVMRRAGQRRRPDLINSVPGRIVTMLERVYNIMPENGPAFRQKVAQVAYEAATGEDPQAVLRHMLDEAQQVAVAAGQKRDGQRELASV